MKNVFLVFSNKKMFFIFLMNFFSGIPLALTASTLQAWMASIKIDLATIGLFSLVAMPYTLKFLWAPFLDRYTPPFLGKRRGWMFITQIILFFSICSLGYCDPTQQTYLMAFLAFLVSFASATQDIAIDAYKVDILEKDEIGPAMAIATLGYRLAILSSGAFALILSDRFSWTSIYVGLGSIYLLALIITSLAPNPPQDNISPKTIKQAFVDPFNDFFKRKGFLEILLFIIIYKLDVVATLALMTPFFMELGFTKTDIGTITKGLGLIATILGTFTGGALLVRLGIFKSLWVFGFLQGISGITFYLMAKIGYNYPLMVTTITLENFFSGMGNAAYSAFLISLCNPKFSGTQYALLSGLMAFTRTIAGGPSGHIVKAIGWEMYYLMAITLAIPGLLLLTRYKKWKLNI